FFAASRNFFASSTYSSSKSALFLRAGIRLKSMLSKPNFTSCQLSQLILDKVLICAKSFSNVLK
ncbi:hypothetical protein NT07LI_3129, partial [Listeria innocua FSL S4-378]